MTLGEKRLLIFSISKISPNDKTLDNRVFRINVKEFAETFGLDPNHLYSKIKESGDILYERSYFEDDGNTKTRYLTRSRYVEKEGYIEITFSPEIVPHLIDLKKYFTSYKMYNVIYLDSFKTTRLYEILKSYEYQKKLIISVDQLKQILEISNQYPLYSTLKKWVLVPSLRNIKEYTDLDVSMKPIRKNRKIVSLDFRISRNKGHQPPLPFILQERDFKDTNDVLRHTFFFSLKDINELKRKYRDTPEILEDTIKYVLDKISSSDIKSPKPYLLKCLQEDVTSGERETKIIQEEKTKIQREIETIKNRLEKNGLSYEHYVNEMLLGEYEKLTEDERGSIKDNFISNIPKYRRKKTVENFEKPHIKILFLESFHQSNLDIKIQSKDDYFKKKKPNHQMDKNRLAELEEILKQT